MSRDCKAKQSQAKQSLRTNFAVGNMEATINFAVRNMEATINFAVLVLVGASVD